MASTRLLLFGALFWGAIHGFAQTQSPSDPVSGSWGDPSGAGFDLKYDSKGVVTGSIRIVDPSGKSTAAIRAGSYDAKDGSLKLEGDAPGPDGAMHRFVIQGTITGNNAHGTYQFGEYASGDFSFSRNDSSFAGDRV
jgi:hypothetical protein